MKDKGKAEFRKASFTVLDVETTGLSPKTNKVIEIGLVKVEEGKITETFSSFINPQSYLPKEITKLTGITEDDLYDAPLFADLIFQFNQFIGNSIIVAHNSQFDTSFLKAEYQRSEENFLDNPVLCTLRLARQLFPSLPSKSLKDVVKFLKIKHKDLHRALSDAMVTAKVLIKMMDILEEEYNITTVEDLLNFQKLPSNSSKKLKITKGVGHDYITIPDSPGVYMFKNSKDKVMYVGKSKSLKQRVSSHLSSTAAKKSKNIIQKSSTIEYKETPSELTALLAESQLIKFYMPKYNVQLKNYSSHYFIKVKTEHEFPDICVTEKIELDNNDYFGPYNNRETAKNLVDVIDKAFMLRECTDKVFAKKKKCYLYDIHRCIGNCLPEIDKELYSNELKNVYDFLSGQNQFAINRLLEKMKHLSEQQKYEEAAEVRDIVNAILKQITRTSIISEPVNKAKVLLVVTYGNKKDYVLLLEGKIYIKDFILNEKEFFETALDDYFSKNISTHISINQNDLEQIKIALTWLVYNRNKVTIHYLNEYETADQLINSVGIPKSKLTKNYNKTKKSK